VRLELPESLRSAPLRYTADVFPVFESNEVLGDLVSTSAVAPFDPGFDARFELPGPGVWEVEVSAEWGDDPYAEPVELQTFELDIADDVPDVIRRNLVPDESLWLRTLREAGAPIERR
jgi:hypothetical protein